MVSRLNLCKWGWRRCEHHALGTCSRLDLRSKRFWWQGWTFLSSESLRIYSCQSKDDVAKIFYTIISSNILHITSNSMMLYCITVNKLAIRAWPSNDLYRSLLNRFKVSLVLHEATDSLGLVQLLIACKIMICTFAAQFLWDLQQWHLLQCFNFYHCKQILV